MVPIFVLLLFALVDFGLIFGGYVSMRNGVQSAARAAAVNNYAYAGPYTCTGGPNGNTAGLICNVASALEPLMGTTTSSLAVGVCFLTPGSSTPCGQESSPGQSLTQDVEVCAQANLQSTTGLTSLFVNGRTVSSSSRVLLEQPVPSGATSYEPFNSSSTPVIYNGATINGLNCS